MFHDKNSRLLIRLVLISAAAYLLSAAALLLFAEKSGIYICVLGALMLSADVISVFVFLKERKKVIDRATGQLEKYISGDRAVRLEDDEEGELYRLYHAVNRVIGISDAHTDNEKSSREFLKETISDISHQLKTPLAALNVYNGIIRGEIGENPDAARFCELSEGELDRIDALVQSLLKITKVDSKTAVFEKRRESLSDILGDTVEKFRFRAESEGKSLSFLCADTVMLVCDRSWISEAVSNIVKNALDHTDEGDSIEISLGSTPAYTKITVRDTGVGIHPEDIHHIFKRFYRSRYSKDTQGVGLGLSLAKAIIEEHDGTIEAESSLGLGTTFTILFLNPTEL